MKKKKKKDGDMEKYEAVYPKHLGIWKKNIFINVFWFWIIIIFFFSN